jgi:hypothetical protein
MMTRAKYTFHIDEDSTILVAPESKFITKAIEAFIETPKLSVLGTFQCTGGVSREMFPRRISKLDEKHCTTNKCTHSLYVDRFEGHWSLRVYMVDNDRWQALWPFDVSLSQLHIERLFQIAFSLKDGPAWMPNLAAWMSLEDFRVCRCFDPHGCHRWGPDQMWTQWLWSPLDTILLYGGKALFLVQKVYNYG